MNEATQKVALEEGSHTQEKRAYVARAYAAAGPTSGLAAATIRRRGKQKAPIKNPIAVQEHAPPWQRIQ